MFQVLAMLPKEGYDYISHCEEKFTTDEIISANRSLLCPSEDAKPAKKK